MELSEEEMNRFLRSVRVILVSREFVDLGENSFWAVAVEYMTMNEAETTAGSSQKKKRIDYREVLDIFGNNNYLSLSANMLAV
jgi:hypothetical protein